MNDGSSAKKGNVKRRSRLFFVSLCLFCIEGNRKINSVLTIFYLKCVSIHTSEDVQPTVGILADMWGKKSGRHASR